MENQIYFDKESGVLTIGPDYILDKPSSSFYKEFPNIKEISVDEANPHYLSEEGVMFSKNKETLIMHPSKRKIQSMLFQKMLSIYQITPFIIITISVVSNSRTH